MRQLGASPVLIYILSSRAFPPDLPEVSYCLLSSALHPLLPADALTLFWRQARLAFGVPNTLVLHKDVLQSYPSLHQLCLYEGVLPEVFLQDPTSIMHKRLQQCSFHAISTLLNDYGRRQNVSLSILDCNDSLLDMPLVFRGHETFSPLSVTVIPSHMTDRLYERVTARQNVARPGKPSNPIFSEIFPPPVDLFADDVLLRMPAHRMTSIGSSNSQDFSFPNNLLEQK